MAIIKSFWFIVIIDWNVLNKFFWIQDEATNSDEKRTVNTVNSQRVRSNLHSLAQYCENDEPPS